LSNHIECIALKRMSQIDDFAGLCKSDEFIEQKRCTFVYERFHLKERGHGVRACDFSAGH
jgi:hypothetical protein